VSLGAFSGYGYRTSLFLRVSRVGQSRKCESYGPDSFVDRLDQQAKAGLDLFDPVVDPLFKPGGEFLEAAVEIGIALDLRLQDLHVPYQFRWVVHVSPRMRACRSEPALRQRRVCRQVVPVDWVSLAAEFAQPAQDCRRALRFGLIDIRTN
jgi:hypothetical protein